MDPVFTVLDLETKVNDIKKEFDKLKLIQKPKVKFCVVVDIYLFIFLKPEKKAEEKKDDKSKKKEKKEN